MLEPFLWVIQLWGIILGAFCGGIWPGRSMGLSARAFFVGHLVVGVYFGGFFVVAFGRSI